MTAFAHVLLLLALAPATARTAASPRIAAISAERPVLRWDAVGHRAMAAMAYDRLRPATRARVDALMRQHPDLARIGAGVDERTADGVRELFIRASIWPDAIRGDARFYRESDTAAVPTPLLPGFPTMARRDGWHYLTRSFSTDGTPGIPLEAPNAATELPVMADAMADAAIPASVRAYHLTWIIHIVGDLHQPMHGTSRSSASDPLGDAGGNRVWVRLPERARDSINLHAVWDGLVGRASRDVPIDDVARALEAALPSPAPATADELRIPDGAALATTVQRWADESATLARYVAYDLPPRADDAPPLLPASYVSLGETIARQRLALAAYRLAALLEARLGDS